MVVDQDGNTKINFIIEKTKETILDFSEGTMRLNETYEILNLFALR